MARKIWAACIVMAAALTVSPASSQPSRDIASEAVNQALFAARPSRCDRATTLLPDEVIAICRGIDIGRGLTPSKVTRHAYSETDAFDRELGRSLRRRGNNVVTVEFEPGQLSRQDVELFDDVYPDTMRIMAWLDRIDETGGQVKVCTRNSAGQLESFNFVTAILTALLDMLQQWTLYRPAENFHARVITDPVAGDAATPVIAIEFIRRSRVDGDLTCQWTRN